MLKAPKNKTVYKDIDEMECLAKTEKDSGNHSKPGMTVYEHSKLTAQVAEELISNKNVAWEDLKPVMVLLAGLHDVGKISPTFQRQIADALEGKDQEKLIEDMGIEKVSLAYGYPRHDVIGYAATRQDLGDNAASVIGAHHGRLASCIYKSTAPILGGEAWQNARLRFLRDFQDGAGLSGELPMISDVQRRFMTGLVTVSDWLSSSVGSETYHRDEEAAAGKVVQQAGLVQHSFKQGLSFRDIFGFEPRAEQQIFIDMVQGPGVYILEAEMGSGKTEAAFYAAYKLLSSGKADGIYFALPTTITSKQIHERMDPFLKSISDEDLSSKLVFSQSVLETMVYGEGAPDWFDSRKRLILAPFGVGTVDQALMGVINVKHSAVRTYGLAGKVVILDEIHSYDEYTGSLVKELVSQCRDLGCTVIILSATLRTETKRALLSLGSNVPVSEAYPLVSASNSSGYSDAMAGSCRHRRVDIRHMTDSNEAVDAAIDRAFAGEYVLWIENSVEDAQEIFRTISARCQGREVGVELLHSRFTDPDRRIKERACISKYSKESPEQRKASPGFILVGTQVLEQSLDIDADVLFTRICPVDMFFQRLGRLWRHERNHEPGGTPVAYLLHPSMDELAGSGEAFGISGAVYSPYVLYRTLEELSGRDSAVIPDDIRTTIEAVYRERGKENGWVAKENKVLADKREKLRSLASDARCEVTDVRPDQEHSRLSPSYGNTTRYSDYEMRDVLLLSAMDMQARTVTLLTGETLSIDPAGMTAKERGLVSLKLEESMITVGIKKTPDAVIRADSMLRHFIYLDGNEAERLCGLLVGRGGKCRDFSGNPCIGTYYSRRLGYYIEGDKE